MIFSSNPFYDSQVRLPTASDPIPPEICNNPKRYPFFKDVIGALDWTHINCSPSEEERQTSHNQKGLLTQNCLIACSFDLLFTYVLSGWEGSAADSLIYHNACLTTFPVPNGKQYLADAGFPLCDQLLVPYRGTRYHLAEWGRANIRLLFQYILFCCLIVNTGQQIKRNCSIFVIHQLAMWLSGSLAF